MKISNKLKLGAIGLTTALIAPVMALPLINATKSKVVEEEGDVRLTDIPTLRVALSDRSYYYVRFATDESHKDWGTFAEIYLIRIDDGETFEKVTFPATFIQEGVEYKLRRISTNQNCYGTGTVNLMDFSQAIWLDAIGASAFSNDHYLPNCLFHIKWVNFTGAKSLRRIGAFAFNHQWFDAELSFKYGAMDFSQCTKLASIGQSAFFNCCEDNKNVANYIIFPPCLKELDISAFGTDNSKTQLIFQKVIYTDPEPANKLIQDSAMPLTLKDDYSRIVVPYGSKDKYINLPKFNRSYKDYVHESTIKFDDENRGSLKLSTTQYLTGVDKKQWIPIDTGGHKREDVKYWLFNDFDGLIDIDDKGHLSWKTGLSIGEHKTRVYCYKYDDVERGIPSVVCSNEISIFVCDPRLDGGTEHLFITYDTPGTDTKPWTVKVNPTASGKTAVIKDCNILNLPSELRGKITPQLSDNQITIHWQGLTDKHVGQYSFTLSAEISIDSENTFTIFKEIFLNIDHYTDIQISAVITKEDGSTEPIATYTGQQIAIKPAESVKFTIKMPSNWSGQYPQLSDKNIEINRVGPEEDLTFEFEFNNAENKKTNNGLYQLFAHTTGTPGNYDIYTCMFNILISDGVSPTFEQLPTYVTVNKEQAGSESFRVIRSQDAIVTKVTVSNAPWVSRDSRIANNKLSFKVDPDDNQYVLASWTNDYSPLDKGAYESLDVLLDIEVQSSVTNEVIKVQKAMTFVGTNKSEVFYDGSENVIEAYPGEKTNSPDSFIFKINDGESLANPQWGFYSDDENLDNYIKIIPNNDNSAYLECDLTSQEAQAAGFDGLHDLVVYVFDEENIVAASTHVTLDIKLEATILDTPEELILTAHQAGKSEKPLFTKVGQKLIDEPVYTIGGLGENMWIDDDNYICWNDQISEGSYEVLITSTVTYKDKEYTAFAYVPVTVPAIPTPEPEKPTNVGAIVGGSVGGAAVLGGTIAGTTIGVKKYKFKKHPKGKKK